MAFQQNPQGPVFGPTQQTTVIGFDRNEKPSGLAIFMGIITMLVSVLICILSLIGVLTVFSASESGFVLYGLLLSCVPFIFSLYGLFSGAMLAFVGGSAGKVFTSVFWVLLLVLGFCLCLFGFLVLGGPTLLG